MGKPNPLTQLEHGKIITRQNYPTFVESFNSTVNRIANLKGDGDVDPQNGKILIDNSNWEHPILRLSQNFLKDTSYDFYVYPDSSLSDTHTKSIEDNTITLSVYDEEIGSWLTKDIRYFSNFDFSNYYQTCNEFLSSDGIFVRCKETDDEENESYVLRYWSMADLCSMVDGIGGKLADSSIPESLTKSIQENTIEISSEGVSGEVVVDTKKLFRNYNFENYDDTCSQFLSGDGIYVRCKVDDGDGNETIELKYWSMADLCSMVDDLTKGNISVDTEMDVGLSSIDKDGDGYLTLHNFGKNESTKILSTDTVLFRQDNELKYTTLSDLAGALSGNLSSHVKVDSQMGIGVFSINKVDDYITLHNFAAGNTHKITDSDSILFRQNNELKYTTLSDLLDALSADLSGKTTISVDSEIPDLNQKSLEKKNGVLQLYDFDDAQPTKYLSSDYVLYRSTEEKTLKYAPLSDLTSSISVDSEVQSLGQKSIEKKNNALQFYDFDDATGTKIADTDLILYRGNDKTLKYVTLSDLADSLSNDLSGKFNVSVDSEIADLHQYSIEKKNGIIQLWDFDDAAESKMSENDLVLYRSQDKTLKYTSLSSLSSNISSAISSIIDNSVSSIISSQISTIVSAAIVVDSETDPMHQKSIAKDNGVLELYDFTSPNIETVTVNPKLEAGYSVLARKVNAENVELKYIDLSVATGGGGGGSSFQPDSDTAFHQYSLQKFPNTDHTYQLYKFHDSELDNTISAELHFGQTTYVNNERNALLVRRIDVDGEGVVQNRTLEYQKIQIRCPAISDDADYMNWKSGITRNLSALSGNQDNFWVKGGSADQNFGTGIGNGNGVAVISLNGQELQGDWSCTGNFTVDGALNIDTIDLTSLNSLNADITSLTATEILATDLTATDGSFSNLTATNLTSNNANITSLTCDSLNTTSLTASSLDTTHLTCSYLTCSNDLTTTNLTASTADITSLTCNSLTAQQGNFQTSLKVNGEDVLTSVPIATTTSLGVVQIGDNLAIDENGVLSAAGGGSIPADLTCDSVYINNNSFYVTDYGNTRFSVDPMGVRVVGSVLQCDGNMGLTIGNTSLSESQLQQLLALIGQ